MTAIQREIVRAMLDTNGNAAEAARKINRTRNTVCYHLEQIQRETGLDPKSFRDLLSLADMAECGDELAEQVERCNRCGAELNRQNIMHTRIITCDGYSNTSRMDAALCIGCSANLISYTKTGGVGG